MGRAGGGRGRIASPSHLGAPSVASDFLLSSGEVLTISKDPMLSFPKPQNLIVSEQLGVLTITLDRASARNAMNLQMVRELTGLFQFAEAQTALRVLVLRGAGGHFCAGADVNDFVRARTEPVTAKRNPAAELNAAFGHLCTAFAQVSLPTVCVLEGAVLGGGFGLACVSDLTLAKSTAMFGLPETSLGVVPAQIAPFLVERLGFSEAKRLALSGGRIGAQEALGLGLVHEVHESDEALAQALVAAVDRFLLCAPEATRATKRLLLRAKREPAEALIEHAAQVFASALTGPEGVEGTRAFQEKRPASWAVRKA
jgi:isohexenylglutaconyl-CoA hydratase